MSYILRVALSFRLRVGSDGTPLVWMKLLVYGAFGGGIGRAILGDIVGTEGYYTVRST